MDPKTLLITGFAPFGTESVNPSWEAVKALPEHIGAWSLHKLLLPSFLYFIIDLGHVIPWGILFWGIDENPDMVEFDIGQETLGLLLVFLGFLWEAGDKSGP